MGNLSIKFKFSRATRRDHSYSSSFAEQEEDSRRSTHYETLYHGEPYMALNPAQSANASHYSYYDYNVYDTLEEDDQIETRPIDSRTNIDESPQSRSLSSNDHQCLVGNGLNQEHLSQDTTRSGLRCHLLFESSSDGFCIGNRPALNGCAAATTLLQERKRLPLPFAADSSCISQETQETIPFESLNNSLESFLKVLHNRFNASSTELKTVYGESNPNCLIGNRLRIVGDCDVSYDCNETLIKTIDDYGQNFSDHRSNSSDVSNDYINSCSNCYAGPIGADNEQRCKSNNETGQLLRNKVRPEDRSSTSMRVSLTIRRSGCPGEDNHVVSNASDAKCISMALRKHEYEGDQNGEGTARDANNTSLETAMSYTHLVDDDDDDSLKSNPSSTFVLQDSRGHGRNSAEHLQFLTDAIDSHVNAGDSTPDTGLPNEHNECISQATSVKSGVQYLDQQVCCSRKPDHAETLDEPQRPNMSRNVNSQQCRDDSRMRCKTLQASIPQVPSDVQIKPPTPPQPSSQRSNSRQTGEQEVCLEIPDTEETYRLAEISNRSRQQYCCLRCDEKEKQNDSGVSRHAEGLGFREELGKRTAAEEETMGDCTDQASFPAGVIHDEDGTAKIFIHLLKQLLSGGGLLDGGGSTRQPISIIINDYSRREYNTTTEQGMKTFIESKGGVSKDLIVGNKKKKTKNISEMTTPANLYDSDPTVRRDMHDCEVIVEGEVSEIPEEIEIVVEASTNELVEDEYREDIQMILKSL